MTQCDADEWNISVVFDEPFLQCPLPETTGTEREEILSRKQIIGKRLHHREGQLPFADSMAERRKRGRYPDALLFGDGSGNAVIEHRREAAGLS